MHGIHTRTHTQALAHTETDTHTQRDTRTHTHTQCELSGIYTSAHRDLLQLLLLFRLVDSV